MKAAAFEGLLEKAASEGKKGAGQYFTPRILIQSIVRCMKPDPRVAPEFTICDPACGTGGFLVAAYEWLMDADQRRRVDRELAKRRPRHGTYFGQELVAAPAPPGPDEPLPARPRAADQRSATRSTRPPDGRRFDVVLTNPPFGTKGANQAPDREDFTIATSNKQLNFIQHVMTILKPGGRAAVVVPDNCLFADQAGEVFKILTEDCDLHTVLRLPERHVHALQPGHQDQRRLLHQGLPDRDASGFTTPARTSRASPRRTARSPRSTSPSSRSATATTPTAAAKRKPSDSKEDRWR